MRFFCSLAGEKANRAAIPGSARWLEEAREFRSEQPLSCDRCEQWDTVFFIVEFNFNENSRLWCRSCIRWARAAYGVEQP